jgi:hypothetical protein
MICVSESVFVPDQSPGALHDVVLVDNQVIVNSFETIIDRLDELNVTVGVGILAVAFEEELLLSPPPHETRKRVRIIRPYEKLRFIIKVSGC